MKKTCIMCEHSYYVSKVGAFFCPMINQYIDTADLHEDDVCDRYRAGRDGLPEE